MKRSNFSISIEFDDALVTLGGSDEVFVKPINDSESATLDEERLNLIRLVREAEITATDDDE